MWNRRALAILPLWFVTTALSAGCSDASSSSGDPDDQLPPVVRDEATYFPDSAWRRAQPSQVGIDGEVLARAESRINAGAWRGIDAILVARYGYLVHERYYGSSHEGHVRTMQSVSKSVTSLVTGIAVDDGVLSTDTPILDILPQYRPLAASDSRKARVTIGQLLEMRAGINFYENPYAGSPLEALNTSRGDWVQVALEQPMNAEPGSRWQYNSGGVIALGAAVQRAAGARFYSFARSRLFTPLGITTQLWVISPFDSTSHTGGGLHMRATDLLRVGYLVLREGRWRDAQVVSRDWILRSTAPRTAPVPGGLAGRAVDYGYLWWLFPIDPSRPTTDRNNVVIVGSGNLNQFVFIVPSKDLVVVNTGSSNDSFGVTVDWVVREVLAGLR